MTWKKIATLCCYTPPPPPVYYILLFAEKPSEDHCKLWSNAILYDCVLNLEAECNQKSRTV